ncbi:hypothetical protein [Microbacterium gorillae]|uniref:hypothetical protein n=1 Tax=Microbacterium gorillae TaxID=1231063 RepID=UPI000AC9B654|nr:hypothetical protein [Microbacterium gorillae]
MFKRVRTPRRPEHSVPQRPAAIDEFLDRGAIDRPADPYAASSDERTALVSWFLGPR